MNCRKILVVDDNDLFRDSIVEMLSRLDYDVDAAPNGAVAIEKFSHGNYDLVISDMKMPGMSGIELLEQIKKIDADVPFLIMTAYGAIDTAVEAMKKGAYDFIQKSDNLIRELELTVQRTVQYRSLVSENKSLKNALHMQFDYIGASQSMEKIRELVKSVAQSRSTVLVTGESGTGKELIARSIHFQSLRSNGPFQKLNCAALPEGLIESELFGHEKGAFTGAIRRKMGKFEAASGGTLLLDEIGELPLAAQAKLLRVLQEREINTVGGDESIEIDVRIIATTNRDLKAEIEKGKFREDLYYRLNVIHIYLPPLRNRKEDIAKLADHFIKKYNNDNGYRVDGLGSGCLEVLTSYDWPGNIRELENAIERAVVLTRNGVISRELFDFASLTKLERAGKETSLTAGMTVAEAERELIITTLEHCNQNRTKAADLLGISIRTLRNKLNEYELMTEND